MSFKKFLIISFVLVAILPISIVGFVSLEILSSQMRQEVEKSNLLISKSLSGEIEQLLNEPVVFLNQVKNVLEDGTLISYQKKDLFLEKVLSRYALLSRIKIIDKQGIVRHQAPYDRNFIDLNLSNLLHIARPLESGKPFWSNTLISLETGHPTITLSIPISDGLLVGHIDLKSLNKIVEKVNVGFGGYAFVVDNKGVTIAHRDWKYIAERRNLGSLDVIHKGLAGNLGTHVFFDEETESLGSISQIEPTGWLVVVVLPTQLAFSSVDRIRNLIGYGSVGALLLALSIAAFAIQRVSTPLYQLIKSAESAAQGDYQSKLSLKGYHELNTLANSFNLMINAIKSRELELKASERKFRNIVEMAPYPIVIAKSFLNIDYVNQSFSDIFGYAFDDIKHQQEWWQIICPNETTRKRIEQNFNSGLKGVVSKQEPVPSYDWDIVCKDGAVKQVEFRIVYIDEMALIIINDLTERKRTEQLLIHSEKMDSIGSLAAGMAHEINNPLAGILQSTQNIKRRLHPDLDANRKPADDTQVDLINLQKYLKVRNIDEYLDIITEAGSRAANIVKNMLQFSRRNNEVVEKADIHQIIEHTILLTNSDFDLKKRYDFKQINIACSFDKSINPIPCIVNELEQVFLNLFSNAAHALKTRNSQQNKRIEIKTQNKGKCVQIEIEDNGPGIPPAIINRIFEPFFTTKPTGEGTGLGLSVAYMIITQHHGGKMEIDSTRNKGTRFILQLPTQEPN
jgi:PAS domain S-box-containing protein